MVFVNGRTSGALAILVLLAACGTSAGVSASVSRPGPTPGATATPAVVQPEDVPDRTVTLTVAPLPDSAGPMLATADAVWIGIGDGLLKVDPATNKVAKTIPLTISPEFLAFGFSSLWVTNFDSQVVLRVDPVTGRTLASIPATFPQGIVATPDGIWVANHRDGTVSRIDPQTNKITATVSVGPKGPSGPQRMLIVDGKIWVGMSNASQVVEVDPATKSVVVTVTGVPSPCGDMAVSGKDLWISECGDQKSVDRVDVASGKLISNTWVAGNVGTPIPVADGVWLPLNTQRLLKISANTGRPVDAVALPSGCTSDSDIPNAVVAFGSIWVGCQNSAVLRLAPSALP